MLCHFFCKMYTVIHRKIFKKNHIDRFRKNLLLHSDTDIFTEPPHRIEAHSIIEAYPE